MTGLDTPQVRCQLCDGTDVEILDVDIWDSGLPQPNRLVRYRCRPCDREQQWLTLIGVDNLREGR